MAGQLREAEKSQVESEQKSKDLQGILEDLRSERFCWGSLGHFVLELTEEQKEELRKMTLTQQLAFQLVLSSAMEGIAPNLILD